ncbi:MAG: glycosyl transferase [Flavobacteriales bacterium]|nr:glycosyl transferase [Flavobacteriales bacterium]
MRILYAIQGTGNGHMARAREIIPVLKSQHHVDILISGRNADLDPGYPVQYRYKGLSFEYGSSGSLHIGKSFLKNNLLVLLRDIIQVPVQKYDLVVNDFEPVTAWAAKLSNVPILSVSHQAAYWYEESPRPSNPNLIGELVLRHYAPCKESIGFHFNRYHPNIFPAIIRSEIQSLMDSVIEGRHITVYLPAYGRESLIQFAKDHSNQEWHVFSKQIARSEQIENLRLEPIDNKKFLESLSSSKAVLCNAGFELPSEALYLGKKLMVIPIKGQYEQECNAAALKLAGVPVYSDLKSISQDRLQTWLNSTSAPAVEFAEKADFILEVIKSIFQENSISFTPFIKP